LEGADAIDIDNIADDISYNLDEYDHEAAGAFFVMNDAFHIESTAGKKQSSHNKVISKIR